MPKIFISHAWEDKQDVADPLVNELIKRGISVWYDKINLKLGDSLRRSIDDGLKNSDYGIIVLSPSFFDKEWTKYELDSLVSLEMTYSKKIIFPIWHNLGHGDVMKHSPWLASKIGVSTKIGMNSVVDQILEAIELQQAPPSAYDLNIDKFIKLNWRLFNTSKKFRNIQLQQENGNSIWSMISEGEELVGINLLNLPVSGILHFEYLIKDKNPTHSNIMFYLIPIKQQEKLVEVGFEEPIHPRNPNSFCRHRIRPKNLIDTWISEEITYDFSDLSNLGYVIFGPRINEGSPFPGKGHLLVKNVRVTQ